jgi:hypothetical protein
VALGGALLADGIRHRGGTLLSQALGMIAAAISLLAVVGYVLDIAALHTTQSLNAMALNTALALMALAIGVVGINPGIGLMRIIAAALLRPRSIGGGLDAFPGGYSDRPARVIHMEQVSGRRRVTW